MLSKRKKKWGKKSEKRREERKRKVKVKTAVSLLNPKTMSKFCFLRIPEPRRREALKPQISKDYAHLCAQKVKFTDSLFGDDVTKQIKDITDDNKVTHKLLDKNRSWYRPSHANRGSARGRAGFRGSSFRGRGSTNRPVLRPSNQYRTTTYSKPRHNQETPKN